MDIDKMQFGFMPGCGTTNAIFILRQTQKKNLANKKSVLYTCRFRESFWSSALGLFYGGN